MIDKTYYSHLISMMKETNGDEKKIYSMNWEGVDYPMTDMTPDDPQKTTDEGLAIYNPEKQEYAGYEKTGTLCDDRTACLVEQLRLDDEDRPARGPLG